MDFHSRPRETRSGELPRLRPPRVESWRARRKVRVRVGRGLSLMIINHSLPSPARFAASTRGPGRFNIDGQHRFSRAGVQVLVFHTLQGHNLLRRARFERPFPTQVTNRKA